MAQIKLHRLRLQPQGATLSPWQADTLFGHLCWEVYFQRGEQGLADFLAPFRAGTPPFVLSDGFPADMFPYPLLPPVASVEPTKAGREQAMDLGKQYKGIQWLTQEQFVQVLRGDRPSLNLATEPELHAKPRLTLKNQINRVTGTTAGAAEDEETGNLYAVEELSVYRGDADERQRVFITIYLWAESDARAEEAKNLFVSLARGGYGKKKSTGYGRFDVMGMDALALTVPDDANGFVVLANFVPAPGDPREGLFKTRVKYGKLGEAANLNGTAYSPFKMPLIMLTAGSTFYSPEPRHFVGRLVSPIHRENPTIVHGAFAPVVPMKLRTLEA